MREGPEDLTRRAARLLRWYPKDWRSRYGDEFRELLISEMSEQPGSWRRAVDVAWSGMIARLASAGLAGHTIDPDDQNQAALSSLGCALGVFLVFGVAMWSQLTIGWQWSAPGTSATYVAMILMSATMLLLGTLALLAAVPIAWCVLESVVRRRSQGLVRPSLSFLAGAALLFLGGRHFGNGWPGTGGHPWAHQGLVPGGVGAFLWASTLSVTSYWAHPRALELFPAAEFAWMAVSPLAMICLVVGAAKTVRRLDLTDRLLRYETCLARLALLSMTAFLLGSCIWVIDGGPGPRNLFHTGAIDVVCIVVMGVAVTVAYRAVRWTRPGGVALIRR